MGGHGDERDGDEGKQVHSTVLIVFVVIYDALIEINDAKVMISCIFKY